MSQSSVTRLSDGVTYLLDVEPASVTDRILELCRKELVKRFTLSQASWLPLISAIAEMLAVRSADLNYSEAFLASEADIAYSDVR